MKKQLADYISKVPSEPVTPVADGSKCLLWLGTIRDSGYGMFFNGKRQVRAHRLIFEQAFGPIPKGMFVCHKCDNPPCVNIAHLFLGTNRENVADMISKDRQARRKGETNANSKITDADALAIRASTKTRKEIAAQYGISEGNVSHIRTGRTFTHLSKVDSGSVPIDPRIQRF